MILLFKQLTLKYIEYIQFFFLASKPNVVSVPVKKKEPDNISEKPKKIDNLPENKPLNKEDVSVI